MTTALHAPRQERMRLEPSLPSRCPIRDEGYASPMKGTPRTTFIADASLRIGHLIMVSLHTRAARYCIDLLPPTILQPSLQVLSQHGRHATERYSPSALRHTMDSARMSKLATVANPLQPLDQPAIDLAIADLELFPGRAA